MSRGILKSVVRVTLTIEGVCGKMINEALVISTCVIILKEIDQRRCMQALVLSVLRLVERVLDMQGFRQLFLAGTLWVEVSNPLAAIHNQQISNAAEITGDIISFCVVSAYVIRGGRPSTYRSEKFLGARTARSILMHGEPYLVAYRWGLRHERLQLTQAHYR